MRKRSLVILLVIALFTGTLFSNSASASVSVKSLQKQIKTLTAQLSTKNKQISDQKKTIASKDKQIADLKKSISLKDKQISDQKNTISNKDKDINYYKSYAATPLKTKVAYQGNVLEGVYQIGNSSIPVLLDYKGVKYAPTDLLGNLLNNKAIFNKSKDTVFFGTEPSGSYMSDLLIPYYSTSTVYTNNSMKMGQQSFTKGYSMQFSWAGENSYAINLGGKYRHITGELGIDDNSYNNGAIVKIYGDNKLIGTYELEKGGLPINIDFEVQNVKKLEIYGVGDYDSEQIDFVNVVIN